MFTCLKVLLSIPVGIGLLYPFFYPDNPGGILGEFRMLGNAGFVITAALFFFLVYLYAKDLMRSLELVSPSSQQASPRSVWLMFLLPYNFIEDFFIIRNVSRSLAAEAQVNSALSGIQSFGFSIGMVWCGAQILSLLPNQIGSVAGFIAIVFWIWHWVLIRRINARLAKSLAVNGAS
ncbi:hypothetical protein [Photobacterium sp. R1]